MDNFCYEALFKEIKLSLNIPGGPVIHGEYYHAVIQVDDDDFGYTRCVWDYTNTAYEAPPYPILETV